MNPQTESSPRSFNSPVDNVKESKSSKDQTDSSSVKSKTPEVVRLSVNLHRGTSDVLQELAKSQKLSITETIRRAISIYKFVMDEQRAGRKVLTMDSDEKNRRELILM